RDIVQLGLPHQPRARGARPGEAGGVSLGGARPALERPRPSGRGNPLHVDDVLDGHAYARAVGVHRGDERGHAGNINVAGASYGDWGSLTASVLSAGAEGGGTTGPMSPSGASSRSTITGAWSLGPRPLRAWRPTHAPRTRSATAGVAGPGSMRVPRS